MDSNSSFNDCGISQFLLCQIYFYFLSINPLSDLVDDLGPGQLFFLLNLFPDKKISPAEAAATHKVSKSRIANATRDMEEKGYLIHIIDEKDRRKKYFSLTKKGQGLANLIESDIDSYFLSLKKKIGEEELKEANRLAEIIAKESTDYYKMKKEILEKSKGIEVMPDRKDKEKCSNF